MTCRHSEKEHAGDEWSLGDMTGLSAEDFGLGRRRISRGILEIHTMLGMSASTSRGSYGSSWESACGENTEASTRTI